MGTSGIAGRAFKIVVAAVVAWPLIAAADPPSHAPAHGWRNKHHGSRYVGFSGRAWEDDYEISSGKCNREAIATVVGGVVGGLIASQVADENRNIATVLGIAAGALVGNKVGEKLDAADRGCVGHALEIGEAGRPVVWENEASGVRYELSPGAERDRGGVRCREYVMVAVSGRDRSSRAGLACQSQDGNWQIDG